MLTKHVGVTFDEVELHDHAGQPDGLFAPDAVALAANESVSDIMMPSRNACPKEEVCLGSAWKGGAWTRLDGKRCP